MIIFFKNFRIRFFKLASSVVSNIERISTKIRNTINIVQCLSYLVVKRFIITENSIVKIQNVVVNHRSQPVKSNPVTVLKGTPTHIHTPLFKYLCTLLSFLFHPLIRCFRQFPHPHANSSYPNPSNQPFLFETRAILPVQLSISIKNQF